MKSLSKWILLAGFLVVTHGQAQQQKAAKPVDPIFALIKSEDLGNESVTLALGKKVVDYLKAHPNALKAINEWGETVLHATLERFLEEPALYLVEQGLDVNKADYTRHFPLNEAINMGSLRLIEAMLKHGAQVKPKEGHNPLVYAVVNWPTWSDELKTNNLKVAELLVNAGADINKDNPLAKALGERNFKVANLLLDHGADVNQPGLVTSFYHGHAFEYNNEVVPLVEGLLLWTLDKNKADFKEGVEMIKKLIAKGAPVPASALTAAIKGGFDEVVEFLRARETKVQPEDFIEAIIAGNISLVNDMFKKGVDVNGPDREGRTPLIVAVGIPTENKTVADEITSILLTNGADVNKPMMRDGKEIVTPLIAALFARNEEQARALVEKGADVKKKLHRDVGIAILEREPDVAIGADVSVIHCAALALLPSLIEIFIKKGVSASESNRYGMTPLHALTVQLPGGPGNTRVGLSSLAIAEQGKKIIAILVQHGAKIDAQDKWGNTALHYAAKWSPELVIALLAACADPCLVNNENKTALSLARGYQAGDQRWQEAIKALEDAMKKAKK